MIDRTNVHITAMIHELAHVEHSSIGARTRVWQFASVVRNSIIGEDCRIAPNVIVDGASIGDRTKIQHHAFIDPGIQIGNDCFLGPGVKLCNDMWPRADVDGWFDINDLISRKILVTIIEDGASIGAGAVLMPGVRIGAGSMVAANATVYRDLAPNSLWRVRGNVVAIDPGRISRKRVCSA
jgi:UDP-2-acetamido-3-amino-2,3-dideoxy-glucuronate N-acetyltransferase